MPFTPDNSTWRDLADDVTEEQRVTAVTAATAFDDIVAAFDQEQLRCEASTQIGGRCLRPVRWRLSIHDCEQVLLCTQHLRAWVREAEAEMRPECAHCGRRFDSLSDGYGVTPA